jgi:hypothetical protein
MNITEYTQLMNKPNAVSELQTIGLEKINWVPYFQSARLRLRDFITKIVLNITLKVTAAHTTDRSILFDFITSDSFNAIQKFFLKKRQEL